MDRHVASLLAMTNKKGFIASTTESLGFRLNSRNDKRDEDHHPLPAKGSAFVGRLARHKKIQMGVRSA
jgi:hypothetical protein